MIASSEVGVGAGQHLCVTQAQPIKNQAPLIVAELREEELVEAHCIDVSVEGMCLARALVLVLETTAWKIIPHSRVRRPLGFVIEEGFKRACAVRG